MKIRRAYKYRIYPNKQQQQQLAVQFGHARFIFNYGLDVRKKAFKETGKGLSYTATALLLPKLKQDLPWLKEADSQVLQQKLKDLDTAYVNFFQGHAGYPTFKNKNSHQAIRYPQRFKLTDSQIYLPKVGWVALVLHRPTEGVPKNATVSKTKSGKYFVSVQCELELSEFSNNLPAVGVDLGLHHFATLSTGEKVAHPAHLRAAEKKLRRLQKALSRTKKGSANRAKARRRVAVLHEKIANQRSDFLHKLSNRLVRSHGTVRLENLNVAGMVKCHSLAKSISDSGWNTFKLQCEYKACQYGSGVQSVDRFFPSSKTCNVCGYVNNNLKLQHRFWTCPECSAEHDRDINAAINIRNFNTVGVTELQACGEDVRPTTFLGGRLTSVKEEAQCL